MVVSINFRSPFDQWMLKMTCFLVKPFLTLFFELFSGHCKKLAPEYAAAAEILAKNDPPFFIGKVDATEQKKVAEKFGVQGFPTLFFFK